MDQTDPLPKFGGVLSCLFWLVLICACSRPSIENHYLSGRIHSNGWKENTHPWSPAWRRIRNAEDTSRLVVIPWVDGGLVVKTNEQIKSNSFLVFEVTAFERLLDIFRQYDDWNLANVSLSGEKQLAVVEVGINRFFKNRCDFGNDLWHLCDSANGIVNKTYDVFRNRLSHISDLNIQHQDGSSLVEYQIRSGRNCLDSDPRSVCQFKLPLRQIGLLNGLLRQLPRVSFGGFHQFQLALGSKNLPRSVFNDFVGLFSGTFHLPKLPLHGSQLSLHCLPLCLHFAKGLVSSPNTNDADHDQNASEADINPIPPIFRYRHGGEFADNYGLLCVFGCWAVTCILIWWGADRLDDGRRLLGWSLIAIGVLFDVLGCSIAWIGCLPWDWGTCLHDGQQHSQRDYLHSGQIVSHKHLTTLPFCNTVNDMANVLSKDKQVAVISALAEGSSIRSIERMTGIHRDTICRLAVRVGKGCEMLLDSKMQDLDCNYLQFDEIWGFIGKKERHVSVDDNPELGDVWTYCAIDSETKLVPSFKCGKRTLATTTEFVQDVASRMRHRVQVSSDAMHSYIEAMERGFGADVDYGQCVKVYVHDSAQHPERKYSAPHFASAVRRPITGQPDIEFVSTSHVERLNGTTRLHVKRLSRLTLAFSKKLENFKAAVALHFAYYNLVKRHNTLRCTPAMAAGVERDFLTVGDLVDAAV